MKKSALCLLCLVFATVPLHAGPSAGLHLPSGAEQGVRERQVDVIELAADLAIDMERQSLEGTVTIGFVPLLPRLTTLALDAADLDVRAVERVSGELRRPLEFSNTGRSLEIELDRPYSPGEAVSVAVSYRAKPETGLYFFAANGDRSAEAWNYGEGGRHYNWLPMYNDTNERFAVDFRITVDSEYTVLGNGTLESVTDTGRGRRTWHWLHEQPIPNYLLALNVGKFVEVPLRAAESGGRSIPLSVWTQAGREDSARFSFGRSPEMLEFFSELLDYPYPWSKFDQVTLRHFDGAMETNTMVGYHEGTLGDEEGMLDDGPELDAPLTTWTREDTIAHELVHHWFGNLVTCRSLGSIWLNESFASYFHTVWNGHANGEDDLAYQRWRYLRRYLDFVDDTGTIRPLEYYRYDASNDMYTTEITYVKGALVLHQLRRLLGDDVFYRGLNHYLSIHAWSEVDSHDLQRALEAASGRNLSAFFTDWVRGGGGHPVLEVSHTWVPERNELDLEIGQVQTILPYQDLFDLALEVEITTGGGSTVHELHIDADTLRTALPVDGEPLSVVVDPGNWIVADIRHELSLPELGQQLKNGGLPAALRAAAQLARDYPRHPEAVAALSAALLDETAHWGLRQEAAIALGEMAGDAALRSIARAASDADTRVRRAVMIALGRAGGDTAAAVLKHAIDTDRAEEIVGAAAIALGGMRVASAREVLLPLVDRPSRYYDVIRHSALVGLAALEDPALAPVFARYVGIENNQYVRSTAIRGWLRAAPRDPKPAPALRRLGDDPEPTIRELALESLGSLHRPEDLAFLRDYAARATDPNLAKAANDAAGTIAAFVGL